MPDPKKTDDSSKADAAKAPAKKDGTRETFESIVIAFIFAFLFRTFEAEAFVIPTGSMAPTLLGRHKDEVCPKCGFEWTVGASEELDRETSTVLLNRLDQAVCPNCRFHKDVRKDPVFVGDRILVTKFSFEVGDPDRWDVTVFKFPEDPTTNYIKRLCGLPGETIEVRQGNLHRIRDGASEILRKQTGPKQLAVLQPVYDDDHPCRELLDAGWPERWAAVARDDGPAAVAGWSPAADGWSGDAAARTYKIAAGKDRRWLRYRHFVPTADDWDEIARGRSNPRPRLVLDFCSYNAARFDWNNASSIEEGIYWVGDLALSATVNVEKVEPGGTLLLELVEGGRRYRCTLDPSAGTATLSYVDALDRDQREAAARVLGTAQTPLDGPGEYDVKFANVDDRLWLWIDGREIAFDKQTYDPFGGNPVQTPTVEDLTPAGIAAENLTATVSHLEIERDVYYRADFIDPATAERSEEGRRHSKEAFDDERRVDVEDQLVALADEPDVYAELYLASVPWFKQGNEWRYRMQLGEQEFLLLGDNSPKSLDGRLWGNLPGRLHREHRHAVPRSALVGKALLIFWPHGLRWGNVQDGLAHGWTIPGLDRFFYHKRPVQGPPGAPPRTEIVADYPVHGVPFYPDFGRILQRIR